MSAEPLDPHGIAEKVYTGELKSLRQSTMGDADVCLKRAGYNMKPDRPYGTGEARIVGTSYHAGLEEYYLGRQAGDPAPWPAITESAMSTFWAEASRGTFEWETSPAEAEKRVLFMLEKYFESNAQWPDDYEILGVEQEWFAPLSDGWATKGTIDLVLRHTPSGSLWLADHKTAGRKWPQGKEHARKNTQTVLYAWAWWYLTGVTVAGFSFDVMTYKGDFERRIAYPQSQHMDAVLTKAHQLARIIDAVGIDDLPGNPSSNLCSSKWCDHWLVCPFGAAGES